MTKITVTDNVLPKSNVPAVIHYTNWRREYTSRSVVPDFLWYGVTQWHPTPQWFLRAFDTDRNAIRDFALEDIGKPPAQSDAAIQVAVVRALEAAAGRCEMRDHTEGEIEDDFDEGYDQACIENAEMIRAIADDPAAVARIAKGVAP